MKVQYDPDSEGSFIVFGADGGVALALLIATIVFTSSG